MRAVHQGRARLCHLPPGHSLNLCERGLMGAGDIFYLTLVVGYIGYCVGYHRGRKFAAAKDAKVLELGRWVASAIEGVRFRQRCGGRGIVTSSTGKAKLANGESYTVTVEMDRP